MQKLEFVLFQIDEARQLIVAGHTAGLRIALILLDNAAEMIMDRWIEQELSFDEVWRRLQSSLRSAGAPEDHPDFVEVYAKHLLGAKEKRRVERLYDEKVTYVVQTKQAVDANEGRVLSHLHRYRNHTYHASMVKEETLRSSAIVLLDLCCRLLVSLKPRLMSFSSVHDHTWFRERFRVEAVAAFDDETLQSIAFDLRSGLEVGDDTIGSLLATNLKSRLDDLNAGLDNIVSSLTFAADRAAALKNAQSYTLYELETEPPYRAAPPDLQVPIDLDDLDRIAEAAADLARAPNGIAAFADYVEPDALLERIEFVVEALDSAIESYVQTEIDRARGK